MRKLTNATRREFGWGIGAAVTLAALPEALRAHDGPHNEVAVEIARFEFDPVDVEIEVGDSVVWSNADVAPHTATASDGGWDTGRLRKGEDGKITFDEPGDYPYFCAFHPHMKGRVVVTPRIGT